jgi:tetratricopeptide (TPR) repeat protein
MEGNAIGGYQILSELGRGGMGAVYLALDPRTGRQVAVKVLLHNGVSAHALSRFQLEGQAVARLDHPGIVRVHELGEDQGRPFLVMDFVEGGSLAQRVESGGPLPAEEAAKLAAGIAEALDHAHRQSIVHRDLKPANVLLASGDVPVLTDFGLAKDLSAERERLTETGLMLGTPVYMSPEQTQGKTGGVDERSDVYSLGATLYEMLTGQPPFDTYSLMHLIAAIHGMEPLPPSRVTRGIDPDLDAICLKCLEKDPDDRYASAKALAEDLRRYVAGDAVEVRLPGPAERLRRWAGANPSRVVSGAVVALLLLAAAVGSAFWRSDADETQHKLLQQQRERAERRKGAETRRHAEARAREKDREATKRAEAEGLKQKWAQRADELLASAIEIRDPVKALEVLTQAIELVPNHLEAYFARAGLREGHGDLRGATEDYTKVIELDPKFAQAYIERAWLRHSKDLKGAIEDYTTAIELVPSEAFAYRRRAMMRGRLGDAEGAMEDYAKGLELAPKNALLFRDRALLRKAEGDLKGAGRDFERALRINPSLEDADGFRKFIREHLGHDPNTGASAR